MKTFLKSILAVLVMSMAFVNANADNTSAQAKKILDKAAAKVSIKSGTQMSFSISSDKFAKQNGTIVVKGKKFNARTPNAIIWFDGKTQWTYLKNNEEVSITTPDASKQAQMNPYTFINLYKKGYSLSLTKSSSGNQVHLVAQGKKSIQELYILVDANYNLKQVKMKQNGTWTTITLSNIKNVNVSDAAFTYKASECPNAEVIDLR